MNDYAYGERNHGPHAVTTANGVEYTYDLNGNLVSTNDGATANWTGFDKPRWLAEAGAGSGFHYNLNRQRVVQHTFTSLPDGATPTFTEKKLYLGGGMEADYAMIDGSLQLDRVRLYVSTPSGRSGAVEIDADYTAGAKHRRLVYHQDHLGSIDVITEFATTTEYVQGAVAKDWAQPLGRDSRYSYDAWGERRDPSDWIGAPDSTTHGGEDDLTPRGFTDHEMLDGLGLVHMNGRIYDPLLGRFLSADPIIQAPANLQSYNRYSYVMNSPLGYVDPSGYTREEYYNQQTSFSQKRLDKFNAATKGAFGTYQTSGSETASEQAGAAGAGAGGTANEQRSSSQAPQAQRGDNGNANTKVGQNPPTTEANSQSNASSDSQDQSNQETTTEIIKEENPQLWHSAWRETRKAGLSLTVVKRDNSSVGSSDDSATFLQVENATAEHIWNVDVTYGEYSIKEEKYLWGLITFKEKGELIRTYTKTEWRFTYDKYNTAILPLPPPGIRWSNIDNIQVPSPQTPTSWYRQRRTYRYDSKINRLITIWERDKYSP